MRLASRTALTLALVVAVAAPTANAAGPTATTAAPAPTTQQPGGSAFGPLNGLGTTPAETEPTVTSTKRAGDDGSGRGTLLFLSLLSLLMIGGVAGWIWHDGRVGRSAAKKRRQRMRSGRTPQTAAAGTGARRGPPPPPRKRRAQAKRKKR